MKVIMTVVGPLGKREVVDHKCRSIESGAQAAGKDLIEFCSDLNHIQKEDWERVELVLQKTA